MQKTYMNADAYLKTYFMLVTEPFEKTLVAPSPQCGELSSQIKDALNRLEMLVKILNT